MRNLPQLPENLEVSTKPKARDGMITQTRRYSLITPLFGGGVEPNNPDPITVVRATSVRGHLRFWWRACRAGKFSNLGEMKAYEDALWGSAAKEDSGGPSQVVVQITEWEEGNPDKPFIVEGTKEKPKLKSRPGTKVPEYAAFPLQPRREDQTPGMPILPVFTDVRFTLQISFPSNSRSDIEAALWAWETFGGIGARTRRGFGALHCQKIIENDQTIEPRLPTSAQSVDQWIKDEISHYKIVHPASSNLSFPYISPKMSIDAVHRSNDAYRSWRFLITKLKNFRSTQQNPSWPESNAIRRLHRKKIRVRRNQSTSSNINKFPRAAFGLPIIFHFSDDSDPSDTNLRGTDHERLASPLILRPVTFSDGGYIGIAVILEGPRFPPKGLQLASISDEDAVSEGADSASFSVEAKLTPDEAKRIVPLRDDPLKVETDVLQAFLNYLKRR